MAVSVTTRPADIFPSARFVPVKNPVVYKFATTGGPFTSYRIEVEVFKASDDTSLTGGVKFSFSPDADSVTIADISAVVKAYLKPEWIEPTTINEVEEDTAIEVYIKYQELYDGSATSVVDDVATPIHCVFGGFQIPTTDVEYSTWIPANENRKFLSVLDRPKLWRGYPATISCIFPDGAAMYIERSQYDASGTIIGSSQSDALDTDNDGTVNRIDLLSGFVLNAAAKSLKVKLKTRTAGTEILSNPEFSPNLSPWVSVAGAGEDWGSSLGTARVVLSSGESSDPLRQDFTEQPAGFYRVELEPDNQGPTPALNLVGRVYLSGALVQEVFSSSPVPVGSPTIIQDIVITGPFDRIEFVAERFDVPTNTVSLIETASLKPLTEADASEELTFDVEDPCDNPVLLFWKNSLGGDSWWMFEYGQEVAYNLSGTKKAKRMTLYGDHLTLNQWEAIQELNAIGEVTAENITELTSSINKTAVRDGSQVYIVDDEGNKTGVIVIPVPSVIHTKDVVHSTEIEIEYPERAE